MNPTALDPQAQARLDEILTGFRAGLPLANPPPALPFDSEATRGKDFAGADRFREPSRDPRRHPFEVYVSGYTGIAATTAKVFVAWGTVLRSETDVTDIFSIANLDDSIDLSAGKWIWIETVFQLDGTIASCELKHGGAWTDFPALYRDDGDSGNTWYQPIAQVREALSGKGGSGRDSGEFPEIKDGLKIAQLTHTHLVKKRECSGDDGMTRIWKLAPGPGGGL